LILRELKSFPNASVVFKHEVTDLTQTEDEVTVTLHEMDTENYKTIKADFCVGADGGRSKVRKLIGQYGQAIALKGNR